MADVNCIHCGRTANGLATVPMGGSLGDNIKTHICADCWQEWIDQQARVINHYGLQLADPDDRKQLIAYMKEFLKLDTL